MAFQTFFLMPALSEAGTDVGKLIAALMRRRIPVVIMAVAVSRCSRGSGCTSSSQAGRGARSWRRRWGWGSGRVVPFLLLFALGAMAVARYL